MTPLTTQQPLPLAVDREVFERHPGTRFAFFLAPVGTYASEADARAIEDEVVSRLRAAFADEQQLRARPEDDAYREFYRSMGLKAAQVSTPVKQAARVLRNESYRARAPVVDVAMAIEYSRAVSFQVYDQGKLRGDVTYRIARGDEPITTMRGEAKTCKPGELILVSGDSVMHSCYYGNDAAFALDDGSRIALVRVMGVPGIGDDAFTSALDEAVQRLQASPPVVLEEATPAGCLERGSDPEEVGSCA